jgi:antitoxin ParD1/3/4
MSSIEHMTITLTAEQAEYVRMAVRSGEYASGSEVIREALRDWLHKRALHENDLHALRTTIQQGLADIEAGRVHDFDADRIIERGEQRLRNAESSV